MGLRKLAAWANFLNPITHQLPGGQHERRGGDGGAVGTPLTGPGWPRTVFARWLAVWVSGLLLLACAGPSPGALAPSASSSSEALRAPPTVHGLVAVSHAQPTATPALSAARAVRAVSPSPVPATARLAALPSPTSRSAQDGPIVFAYYVPYDATSWASLAAHADQITYVVPQTVSIDACGGIATQDDRTLQAFARAHGIGVLPSVFTVAPGVNHRLLTDPSTAAADIQALTAYVVEEGYAGLDVDLESVPAGDRAALTSFVRHLAAKLHARGKLLTMAVPAKQSDVKTGLSGAFDYAALGPSVDLVTVMTYGYSWSGGPPGPIAPYSWVDRVIGYATSQFPSAKVLVGVPFYGYDWNVTTGSPARALRFPQAEYLAHQYGTSIGFDQASRAATFGYVARPGDSPPPALGAPAFHHDVQRHAPPPCRLPTPTPHPATPTPTPTINVGQHVVWLENDASFAAQLGLARDHQTGGVALWRLGQEDPRVWQQVPAHLSSLIPADAPSVGRRIR